MRNFSRLTNWIFSLTAVFFISILAAIADTPLPAPKPAKGAISLKKISASATHAAGVTQNSTPSVISGMDTLPHGQVQKAAAEAALGQKFLDAGDLDAAEAYFRDSVELNNADSVALAGLAQTFDQEGKEKQAIAVYRYLLYPKKGWGTSMEQDPILRMRFALLLAGDGQWKEAVYVYESTINTVAIGPSFPRLDVHFSPDAVRLPLFQAMCHLALGVVYNGRMEHTQALAEYTAALSEQPSLALAHYLDGHGLQLLRRYPEAQAAFKKAAQLDQGGEVKAAAEKELPK